MVRVEARIEHVTVYARGARVRRVTQASATARTIRIADLPLAVLDDTVRVELEGAAIATAIAVAIEAPAPADAAAEEPDEVRMARRRVALVTAEVARLEHALAGARAAQTVAEDPTDEPPAPWTAIVAARRALVATRAERVHVLHDQLRAARREREEAERALVAATDRDRRSGNARAAKLHELRKHVDIELVATDGASGELTVRLEYLVGAARWTPSYVAKLDGGEARIEIRANVAQATGEDWRGVPLALSTAEPSRFAALPELLPLRIGRKQDEPAKSGYRAAPTGAVALYADYLRERSPRATPPSGESTIAMPPPPPAPPSETSPPVLGGLDGFAQDRPEPARKRMAAPAPGAAMPTSALVPPPPPSAPMLARSAPRGARADEEVESAKAAHGGGGAYAEAKPAPEDRGPSSVRLDYANLRMAPPSASQRGQLVPAPHDPLASSVADRSASAVARVLALPLPPGCHAEWSHSYDYAFATDGAVDVAADAAWHSIAVTSRTTTAKVAHVAVPREQADVFRVATVSNPFDGPLLPGPIDIYDRGRFLVTSDVEYTPPASTVEVGLGVDAAVKIARNTEYHEEATGMLRGGLRLVHQIAIDVENLSGRAIELEVRERVPVARDGDDDVEIAVTRAEPPWERWAPDPDAPAHLRLRGGHRWRLAVPAGQKQKLRAGYEVKIASKHELVGGNRREL